MCYIISIQKASFSEYYKSGGTNDILCHFNCTKVTLCVSQVVCSLPGGSLLVPLLHCVEEVAAITFTSTAIATQGKSFGLTTYSCCCNVQVTPFRGHITSRDDGACGKIQDLSALEVIPSLVASCDDHFLFDLDTARIIIPEGFESWPS